MTTQTYDDQGEYSEADYSQEENTLRDLLYALKKIIPFFSPSVDIENDILVPLSECDDNSHHWPLTFLREIFECLLEQIVRLYLDALALYLDTNDQGDVLDILEEGFGSIFHRLKTTFHVAPFKGFLLAYREEGGRGWIF